MRAFLTVFCFEFKELIKSKAFIIVTLILCLMAIVGLALPTVVGEIGGSDESKKETYIEANSFVVYDKEAVLNEETFNYFFPNVEVEYAQNEDDVKKLVKKGKVDAGFVIDSALNFVYYVENSDMMDTTPMIFSEMLSMNYKNSYLTQLGVDVKDALNISSANATYTSETLGNDGANNIFYTFILLFAVYMVIAMYGNIVATSVASEKGNRTMELLATSTNPTALIFGKVLASCLAACVQIGLFLGSAYLTYRFTQDLWNGALDMLFNIPADVLSAFAIFGVFGFIFYSFIFGALGALVSKSEDVNSSATPITIIFVIVYLVVYVGIMNPDSSLFVIASYVPFSSPMAMFARMALVEVPVIEVALSLGILIASTILVGWGASKIYRRATLMYGNQIKFIHAFKWLTKKDV